MIKSHIESKNYSFYVINTLLLILVFISEQSFADNSEYELFVTGIVAERTCSIHVGDEEQYIEFGDINVKKLKESGRSSSKEVTIRLYDCNVGLIKNATLMLKGNEYNNTGNLEVTGEAKGITIGFESNKGEKIDVNTGIAYFDVNSENLILDFLAYVYSNPDEDILEGSFSASVSFYINYI